MSILKRGSIVTAGNVLQATLQFAILIGASRIEGMGGTGMLAIALAAATIISIALTSDARSIGLTGWSTQRAHGTNVAMMTTGTLIAAAIAVVEALQQRNLIFASLLVVRVSQAWSEYSSARWLADERITELIFSTIVRPTLAILVCVLSPFVFKSADAMCFSIALLYLTINILEFRLHRPASHDAKPAVRHWWPRLRPKVYADLDRDDVKMFLTLALTGLLTYSPQYIIRDVIAVRSGIIEVGQFSVTYQLFMAGAPVVSAISQVAMSRKSPSSVQMRLFAAASIGTAAVGVLLAFLIVLLAPTAIGSVFLGFSPLSFLENLALVAFCFLTLCCIFFGFMNVKARMPGTQFIASLVFVSSLMVIWFGQSYIPGGSILYLILAVSAGVRLLILAAPVRIMLRAST